MSNESDRNYSFLFLALFLTGIFIVIAALAVLVWTLGWRALIVVALGFGVMVCTLIIRDFINDLKERHAKNQ